MTPTLLLTATWALVWNVEYLVDALTPERRHELTPSTVAEIQIALRELEELAVVGARRG